MPLSELATMLLVLDCTRLLRCAENSESVASDGWTEMTTSLARYAMRATRKG